MATFAGSKLRLHSEERERFRQNRLRNGAWKSFWHESIHPSTSLGGSPRWMSLRPFGRSKYWLGKNNQPSALRNLTSKCTSFLILANADWTKSESRRNRCS